MEATVRYRSIITIKLLLYHTKRFVTIYQLKVVSSRAPTVTIKEIVIAVIY